MGHWYKRDGTPFHYIEKASGDGLRSTTIRDARKLDLLPSVSTIIGDVVRKPFVERWTVEQHLDHAYGILKANPKVGLDIFKKKVYSDFSEQMNDLKDSGDGIHNALESFYKGEPYDSTYKVYVDEVDRILKKTCGEQDWIAEEAICSLYYAGKPDLFSNEWVIDFKSRDLTEPKDVDKIAYDENLMQLAAYSNALGGRRKCANVFISRQVPGLVLIKVWNHEEYERGMAMWNSVLNYWKEWKKF